MKPLQGQRPHPPAHAPPAVEWAEQAIQVLQEFVMDRDFPEGTWEHTMFMEMEESQLVRKKEVR